MPHQLLYELCIARGDLRRIDSGDVEIAWLGRAWMRPGSELLLVKTMVKLKEDAKKRLVHLLINHPAGGVVRTFLPLIISQSRCTVRFECTLFLSLISFLRACKEGQGEGELCKNNKEICEYICVGLHGQQTN